MERRKGESGIFNKFESCQYVKRFHVHIFPPPVPEYKTTPFWVTCNSFPFNRRRYNRKREISWATRTCDSCLENEELNRGNGCFAKWKWRVSWWWRGLAITPTYTGERVIICNLFYPKNRTHKSRPTLQLIPFGRVTCDQLIVQWSQSCIRNV